jgi:hypothetical protein
MFPKLEIEAPPEFQAIRTRLESLDPLRFADIAQLVGADDGTPPIHVLLAPENSNPARSVPPWIAGFAVETPEVVVIFPARSPSYPDASLEDVLRHEVAHVLIGRASGGQSIPRWFNEGLAMAVERERRLQDQTQLLYQLVSGSRANLEELNTLFSGSQNDQTRAYALAGALVHDLIERHGSAVCRKILNRVRSGDSFDAAFKIETGSTLDEMQSDFWRRQRIWTFWIPLITSSTALWLAVTMLAILAIYMRRRKNRQIEQAWEKEENDRL